MLKSFFKNSLTYNIGNILTLGIALFLLPIYTKYLSPEEFGTIDLFYVIGTFINLTIALEISQGLARYYQDAIKQKEKKEYTSTAFWFTVLVYLIFFFLCFLFSESFTSWLLLDKNKKYIFLLATLAISTLGIFVFTWNQLKWQIQPKESVITSLIYFFVLASVTVYLLVVKGFKVESIFIGQITGNITASLVAYFYSRKSYGFIFSTSKFKKMVSYSAPLVLSSIGLVIAVNIDRIAIKDLLGLEELGIYGVAYRFAAVAGLIMIGFQESLTPLIFKNYKRKKTPSDISKIFNIFIIFASLAVAGSILFSKEIVILFTTEIFYSSANLITLLILSVFFSNIFIFTPGLSIAKKTKLISVIAIFGAIINTILNYTLIPIFGLSGAAYATLISSMCGFLLYLYLSNKHYPIPFQFNLILISFFIVLITSYGFLNLFNEINLKSIIIKILYLLIVLVTISFLLIEKKYILEMKLLLKRKGFKD